MVWTLPYVSGSASGEALAILDSPIHFLRLHVDRLRLRDAIALFGDPVDIAINVDMDTELIVRYSGPVETRTLMGMPQGAARWISHVDLRTLDLDMRIGELLYIRPS